MFDRIKKLFSGKDCEDSDKLILVVEDNPVDLKVITKILESKKYKVISAANGEEGLKIAKDNRPDLMILDCQMPVLNGLEMCKMVKEDVDIKDIPVIFLTGIDTSKNVLDCFEADAWNYLSKPIDAKVLMSEIEAVINKNVSDEIQEV